ncbi:MAG: hypothetical protein IKQ45_02730 [Clostridia bacterium]|nr:hypothetical protein [Clostridia bacterium]
MRRKAVVLLLVAALLLCVVPASASDVPSDGYIPEREVRLSNGHGSYMPDDQCKWYSNTVCVLGLPLRELDPELTDRWYQIVPVDVSADAVYTYPMVAGSIYYLGECRVTVRNGQVTTDYLLPEGRVFPKEHCLMWFTSLNEITAEFLDNPVSSFRFGEPVSVAEKLNGQRSALLFICNRASYRMPVLYSEESVLRRFYSTNAEVTALRAEMTELLKTNEINASVRNGFLLLMKPDE